MIRYPHLLSFLQSLRITNDTQEKRHPSGCGPLLIAAEDSYDNANYVHMVLGFGADINQRAESDETTALHRATRVRNINVVNALLRRGADPSLADKYGCTPLFYAAGPRGNQIPSYYNSHRFQLPLVRSLLSHGADVNARNHQGETPLIYAANTFNLDVVKALLQAGADVHCKDIRSRTCLHHLFSHPGKTKILVELIKAGASVFYQDDDGIDSIGCIVNSMKHTRSQKVQEVKELVRCATLVKYPEKLYFPIHGIGLFDEECYAEVQAMQSVTVGTNWTLCDFALHGIGENPESTMDSSFAELLEDRFVIYNDYVVSQLSREFLVSKIKEREIAIYSSNDQMGVKLPNHFKEDFCNCLTKTDIYILLKLILNSPPAQ